MIFIDNFKGFTQLNSNGRRIVWRIMKTLPDKRMGFRVIIRIRAGSMK